MTDFTFIRYANCWEDSNNLLKCLESNKKILSICSAGDNTISLLLNKPKKIVAFDINKTEIYLLKLKMAAFKKLSYEEILILLGIKKGDAFLQFQKLKKILDKECYTYFLEHKKLFKKGIIHSGKFEKYFQMFRKYIIPLFTTKKKIYLLATASNLAEQKNIYDQYINNKRLNFIFKIFFGFRVMGKYGRDKSFYDHVPNKEKSAYEIKERFDQGITRILNKTNPYITYVLLNKYTDEALPVYLRKENYDTIKENINKIEIVTGSLLDIKENFDYFNLSDIFEYMSEDDFYKNINHVDSISNKNSKIVYYNMQNKRYIKNKKFVLNTKLSEKIYKENQSYFYRDFLVYEKSCKNE